MNNVPACIRVTETSLVEGMMTPLRVWAEELEPENTLRLTWTWTEEDEGQDDPAGERETVLEALQDLDGITTAQVDDEGVIVTIDPERVARPALATAVREALDGSEPEMTETQEAEHIRVFAEDLDEQRLRVTWKMPEGMGERDEPSERRRVAAWLEIQPAIKRSRLDDEGVTITYLPDQLDRREMAEVVRKALRIEEDLRTRANDLLRRTTTYGNLASKLALDERISPLPNAARQAAASRTQGGIGASAARTTAMRMIPGAATIQRIQTLMPVIQSLATWSREDDPELVDEHLANAGLDRETLEADNATAHEVVRFARDYAGEKAGEIAGKAADSARKAIDLGRDWIASRSTSSQDQDRSPDEP